MICLHFLILSQSYHPRSLLPLAAPAAPTYLHAWLNSLHGAPNTSALPPSAPFPAPHSSRPVRPSAAPSLPASLCSPWAHLWAPSTSSYPKQLATPIHWVTSASYHPCLSSIPLQLSSKMVHLTCIFGCIRIQMISNQYFNLKSIDK